MDELRKRKYAQMLVKVGVNLQAGQYLIIQTIPEALELANCVTEEAFKAGAKDVIVFIEDPKINHLRAQYAEQEVLRAVPQWKLDQLDFYLSQDACQLSLMGTYPTLNKDIASDKLLSINAANNDVRNVIRKYIHKGILQWTGTAVATQEWANTVYPELDEIKAFDALEDALCKMTRVEPQSDVVKSWAKHCVALAKRAKSLNEYNFKSLHITTELGTDITMDLVIDHIWSSAGELSSGKHRVPYVANIPTEEIFTDPHCFKVNGIVYASKPLLMSGKLVTDFNISFKDGYAMDCFAQSNEDVLRDALFKDEGTRRLGEVALVSKFSPINQMNRVFFNGLIDENASSHLAFGSSFPSCIKNGLNMNKEELLAQGVNVAVSHNDFMIGTDDMKVVGIKHDGQEIVIMVHGDFAN